MFWSGKMSHRKFGKKKLDVSAETVVSCCDTAIRHDGWRARRLWAAPRQRLGSGPGGGPPASSTSETYPTYPSVGLLLQVPHAWPIPLTSERNLDINYTSRSYPMARAFYVRGALLSLDNADLSLNQPKVSLSISFKRLIPRCTFAPLRLTTVDAAYSVIALRILFCFI